MLICAFVLSPLWGAYGQTISDGQDKPNVLFILIDDLGASRLRIYGDSVAVTPNIDRLGEMGQVFLQAYDSFPNCGPSRASLLSGLYTSRARWIDWRASQNKEVPGVMSLPMWFKIHGYTTVSLGKVYNNFADGRGSWDRVWRPPTTTTNWDYQKTKNITIFLKRNKKWTQSLELHNKYNLPKRGPAYEKANVKDIAYRDGRIAIRAIEFLQKFKQYQKTFFLAVGFHGPHLPFSAPRRYWEMYDKEDIDLPPNMYQPHGAPGVSMTHAGELRAYSNVPDKGPIPDSLALKLIHGYYANLSYVDRQVGRVINALEALGLAKNTIIVLWGDQGFCLGEHSLWGKHNNYRITNHIPLIIKAPGKKRGVRQHGLVETVDIYPTLCDLAGLDKPFHLQGHSFAKKMEQPAVDGKKYVFWRANTGRGETVMTQNFTYTEFFNDKGDIIAKMLYDLRVDPHENYNVIDKPTYDHVIQKLHERLHKHMRARNIIHLK